MENIVDVNIWDLNVGSLIWNKENEYAVFEFNSDFSAKKIDLSPIIMPLSESSNERLFFPENRNKCFKGLPGFIADSLPDDYGNDLIDSWFASEGYQAMDFTPLDRLCYVGKRGMGALEYSPSITHDRLEVASILDIEELTEFVKSILNDRETFEASLKNKDKAILDILKIVTPAGGAKPKAIIAYNPITKEVRSGQVKALEGFGYYLLKFDGVENVKISDNPLGIGNIEYAYYQMAIDCGIDMMESTLLCKGNYSHFMTKRFDRTETGEKIHSQTLSAIANFNKDSHYSYEQAFQVMRMLHLPNKDFTDFFRRMVFNVVAKNHDDHTKNHSFLMDKTGEWKLAPAYDLSCSYFADGRWRNQHQMSINGKRDNFEYSDLLRVGQRQMIKNAKDIIDKTIEIVSQWKKYAFASGVCPDHLKAIGSTHLLLS